VQSAPSGACGDDLSGQRGSPIASARRASFSLSTFRVTPAAIAASSSLSRLPGPAKLTSAGSMPASVTSVNSPPEAMSNPSASPVMCSSTGRKEFALTA
jgi:hypothetical protein